MRSYLKKSEIYPNINSGIYVIKRGVKRNIINKRIIVKINGISDFDASGIPTFAMSAATYKHNPTGGVTKPTPTLITTITPK